MIWVTWRQHRVVLALITLLTVGLIAWLAVVSNQNHEAYQYVVHHHCRSDLGTYRVPITSGEGVRRAACDASYETLVHARDQAAVIEFLLWTYPLVVGMLLGASLIALEFERKTAILGFTQSVSRTRWFFQRLLVAGIGAVVTTTVLTVLVNRWFSGLETNATAGFLVQGNRIQPGQFDVSGIVPIAYAVFALALGAALGALLRRTIWAGFGTIAVFISARLAFSRWLRPDLATQVFIPERGASLASSDTAWLLPGNGFRVIPGRHLAGSLTLTNPIIRACLSGYTKTSYTRTSCLASHGIQAGWFSQPSSHFWQLQWGEAGAFVVSACALVAITLWSVRRWRA